MKLKAIKQFTDVEANKLRNVGEIFEATEGRGAELLKHPKNIVEQVIFQTEVSEKDADLDMAEPLKTETSFKNVVQVSKETVKRNRVRENKKPAKKKADKPTRNYKRVK